MKSLTLCCAGVGLCILLVTCSTTQPDDSLPPATFFVVKVDSLQHPSAMAVDDTLTIRMFGIIGNSGCYSFSHIDERSQPLRLDLQVWGKFTPAYVCQAVMVYLDRREYKFKTSTPGTLYINFHQPDGSILTDSVLVE